MLVYVSLHFAGCLQRRDSDVPGANSVRIVINFVSADNGATQRLGLDARDTGSPFPETFALRFPGEPTHVTIGPGMFLTSSGTLEVTLTGVARSPDDTASPPNPYLVPLRCFIDDCDTDAHFPDSRDLTDEYLTFTGLVLDITLDTFERCSVSRPDCDGVSFDGFSLAMLAGEAEATVSVPLDRRRR